MAYQFNSNQYLSTASTPVTAAPFSVSAWFRVDNTTGNKAIVSIAKGGDGIRWLLYTGGSSPLWFVSGVGQAGSGTVSANTWTHCCAVEAASNSRTLYTNGTAGSTNTASGTPSGVSNVYIGSDGPNSNRLTGQVADVGIWDVALTAAEITSLSKGVSCRLIRPQSLVFYAPLIRDLVDVRGARTITNNGTATVSDHPRIYR